MFVAEILVERAAVAAQRRIAWLTAPDRGADVAETEWLWHQQAGLGDVTEATDAELAGPLGTPWRRIVELFDLAEAEADLLSLAVALDAEPSLGPVFAEAQSAALDDAGSHILPSESLVRRLFGHGPEPIWRPSSPLAQWSLATPVPAAPGAGRRFVADSRITDMLFGRLSVSEELVLAVEEVAALPVLDRWPVELAADQLTRAVAAGQQTRVVVADDDPQAQISFATAVARRLNRRSVVVDPTTVAVDTWPRTFMLAQRFALLADVALIWRAGGPAWPRKIGLAPLQFVGTASGVKPVPHAASIDLVMSLPALAAEDKAQIWRELSGSLTDAAEEVGAIAGVRMQDLVVTARKPLESLGQVADDLRAQARTRMDGTGRIVDPTFTWDDLVIADHVESALRRVRFEARTRAKILETAEVNRLFGGSAGLSALFWGPPGVGKSMAAEVIAHDLGANLLVVDLAATMSKYIGETAKNLTAVFAEAKASGAALIFEEADTFFGKRVGARDTTEHYRNGDTNHLLQLLDGHDSLVMLSTNDRSTIDPAFIRRIRHVIEFPLPDPVQRLELWHRMLAAFEVDHTALDGSVDDLANSFPLSPAQIKSGALTARYAAAAADEQVTFTHLEEGAARELVKEGRPGVATGARQSSANRRRNGGSNGSR